MCDRDSHPSNALPFPNARSEMPCGRARGEAPGCSRHAERRAGWTYESRVMSTWSSLYFHPTYESTTWNHLHSATQHIDSTRACLMISCECGQFVPWYKVVYAIGRTRRRRQLLLLHIRPTCGWLSRMHTKVISAWLSTLSARPFCPLTPANSFKFLRCFITYVVRVASQELCS